jgi:NAD+ diphosphatase
LNAVARSPNARYLVFRGGQPLISQSGTLPTQPAQLPFSVAAPWVIGSEGTSADEPIFGQGQNAGDSAPETDIPPPLEAARFRGATLVFLGLLEPSDHVAAALPSTDFSAKAANPTEIAARVEGIPYFALDVSDVGEAALNEVLQAAGEKPEFSEPRVVMMQLGALEGAIFAEARTMLDWNLRNKVCL